MFMNFSMQLHKNLRIPFHIQLKCMIIALVLDFMNMSSIAVLNDYIVPMCSRV